MSLSPDGRTLVAMITGSISDAAAAFEASLEEVSKLKPDDPRVFEFLDKLAQAGMAFAPRVIRIAVEEGTYDELKASNLPPNVSNPSWTPDGTMLFLPFATTDGVARLMRLNADNGDFEVVSGAFPARKIGSFFHADVLTIHPDGVRLAVETTDNAQEIWAIENVSSFLKAAR
jgi:hypothetical protein